MNKLKIFILEIKAIREEIKTSLGQILNDDDLRERLKQLLETWYAIRGYVTTFYKNNNSLNKVDALLECVARDSNRKILKRKFNINLKLIEDEIASKIQIEEFKFGNRAELSSNRILENKFLEEIPDLPLQLIPKSIIGWKGNIKDFLLEKSFDRNVFIMTRYVGSENVIKVVKAEVDNFEYNDKKFNPIIADKYPITDDLYNPIACLLCCQYGIAIFDAPTKGLAMHNPNVAYELGFMHLLQRKCIILKSKKLKSMPTDILQKLYIEYSSTEEASEIIKDWLTNIVR